MKDTLFIDYEEKLSVPLYKYYGNLDHAKNTIENHSIHFESPEDYNDVYDSAMYVKDEDFEKTFTSGERFLQVLDIFFSNEEGKKVLKEKISPMLEKKDRVYTRNIIDIVQYFFENITRQELIGSLRKIMSLNGIITSASQKISCFSENKDSLLMWAYYANKHQGVCLEFDIKNDEKLSKHCHKIQYTKHFGVGNYSYTYFTKSTEWSHEQEWRIVTVGTEYEYTDSLKSVYLGCKMDETKKAMFIDLCKEYKLNLYQVKPSTTEFKLEFEKLLKDGEPITDN